MHSDGVVGYLGIHIPIVANHRVGFRYSSKSTYKKQGLFIMNMWGVLNFFVSYCRLDACNEISFNS